jgi:twitching motility protein PilT
MQVGQDKYGMQTMNQSLYALYARRQITLDDAMGRSTDPEELKQMINNPTMGMRPAQRR